MADTARPFIVIYVVWHPKFALGHKIAKVLFEHFRRESFEKITGGTGMSVVYRFATASDGASPLPIDFSAAETSAVIVLVDKNCVSDDVWLTYLNAIADQTDATGLGTRLFPVLIEPNLINNARLAEQALQWCQWEGSFAELTGILIGQLTFQFCRMLRHYLEHLRRPGKGEKALLRYLEPVGVFLSHSKHDGDKAGERVAKAVRQKLSATDGLDGFFDHVPGRGVA
ncbi:hypothetical protein [Rhizobium pisi]|uniref:hypothetical protein n=1 Tax=Rhizobium TaxID=379 RepID=UPI003D01CFFA